VKQSIYSTPVSFLQVTQGAPEHIFEEDYRTPSTDLPQTNKYTISIEYNQLSEELKQVLYTCQNWLQPWYIDYVKRIDASSVLARNGEIKCFVKAVPQWEKVSECSLLGHVYPNVTNMFL
jgi:hypothetical protein